MEQQRNGGFPGGDVRVAFNNCDFKLTLALWDEGMCLRI